MKINFTRFALLAYYMLFTCFISIAQSTDIVYKEKGRNYFSATLYFSDETGNEGLTPDRFFDFSNIYFTIKPNPNSEKECFRERDAEECFSQIRLFQYGSEISPAQPPKNITNAEGKVDKVLLTYPKRDVKLFKPFTFINHLDTSEAINIGDTYYLYYGKYQPIYSKGMLLSDELKYIETYKTLMEIVDDVTIHQEIKYYSFYEHATEIIIGNAIEQQRDSLSHLLKDSEYAFLQSFEKSKLNEIDSIYNLIEMSAETFAPYFGMDFPKSRQYAQEYKTLLDEAKTIRNRNFDRFKSNKLYFLQDEDYSVYKFSFYIDLIARMVTNLDSLIVIKELDTLNMAALTQISDAKKELKITGWEQDFTTVIRMLNKEIDATGKLFNDSIMSNLQRQKIYEKQPYQQIFLAFNALSTNEMLFENFLKGALKSCTDEDLIDNIEMWLLSYNLTFENVSENTVLNINDGLHLIEQQRWEEAINVFNTITRQANTIAPPWFYMGLILYEQEQTFAADAKFDLALDIYPGYIAPWLFKFKILSAQEEYDKLLSKADEALIENDIWIFHYWRAKALFETQDYNAAIRELEEACIKMNPYNTDEYFLLGDAYLALSNFNQAGEAYNKTQQINPHDVDIRYNEKMQNLQNTKKGNIE